MFAHLHCHFLGSYSDSLLDPGRELSCVKEMGQEALAITDHGVIDYCVPFYQGCRRVGLHPVIGCEVYFVEDARKSIEENDPYRNHLILLARDNRGFANLVRMVNRSWLDNSFGEIRGLVDWKLLTEYHEGLIALSACFWGSLPQKYITGGLEEAAKEFQRYFDIFGRDFYPELGRHGIPDEEKANRGLIELSRRFGVTPVVTNDAHYRRPEDWEFHDVIIKTRFGYGTDFELDVRNYYLKSEEEMRALGFPPECYDTTVEIAHRCRVDLDALLPDLEPGTLSPADEVVFGHQQVVIDAAQAIRDVCAAWKIRPDVTGDLLAPVPAGMPLGEACREFPDLRAWLDRNPRIKQAAERIEGIPRVSRPDFGRIVPVSLPRLRDCLPVKRSRGEIIAAYPSPILENFRVPLAPVSALSAIAPGIHARIMKRVSLEDARTKMDRGEAAGAALLLEALLRADPDNLDARYLLADALYSLRRYGPAAAEYGILAESDLAPRLLPRVLTRQGWSYSWLREPEKSIESFEKALRLNGNYGGALYGAGVINYRQGKPVAARAALECFLSLYPEGNKADKARALLGRLNRSGNEH